MIVRAGPRVQRGRPVLRGDGTDDEGRAGSSPDEAAAGILGSVAGSRSDVTGTRDEDGERPSEPPRAFLYSRQQFGQRHSTTIVPSPAMFRVSRHPNCELMRV
jgi:hypothetical protein